MTTSKKPLFKNTLAEIRASKHLEQKHVATLLGHKSIRQISRYEQGLKVPNLKTALKLAQIYQIPIRIMLDGYYEACREEVLRQEKRLSLPASKREIDADQTAVLDYCTFEKTLLSDHLDKNSLSKIRRHSAYLIRKTAEKLGHI